MGTDGRRLDAMRTLVAQSRGIDVQAALSAFVPRVVVGDTAENQPAREAAILLVNLLCRMFPVIALAGDPAMLDELRALMRNIDPAVRVVEDATFTVCVNRAYDGAGEAIHLGAQGWRASVSHQEIGVAPGAAIFSALVAACLGAWEVVRRMLGEHLGGRKWEMPHFGLNLLSYEAEDPLAPAEDAAVREVRLPKSYLIGAGALGHAIAYAVHRVPLLRAEIEIVDNREVKDDTAQRYIWQFHGDAGTRKAALLASRLQKDGLQVSARDMHYVEFLAHCKTDLDLDVMLVAVDTPQVRALMQGALPRMIINGWTDNGEMGVTRHGFLGDYACLSCLYGKTEKEAVSEAQVIARAFRGLDQRRNIAQMIIENQPLDAEDIAVISQGTGIAIERLQVYVGKTAQSAYQGVYCSGMLAATPEGGVQDVPLPFMSALVGTLQALELVKEGDPALSQHALQSRLHFAVASRPDLPLAPLKKRDGCICSDRDYLGAYREKWGSH